MSSLVSIVVPVYNRERFLTECVQSVINQNHKNWELLLIDDGSTDNSLKLAQSFAQEDTRIKSIQRNRQLKGAPTCRNIGLENTKGDYVIFLDSDDLMAPYCLEQRLAKVLELPNNDFWVFPMLIFKNSIDDTRRLTNYATQEADLYRFLRSDIVWTISCPIWKKSALLKLGGFDESFPNCQDHDLHLRAILEGLKYKKFLDQKPDTFYRKHDGEKIYKPSDPLRVLLGINALFNKLSDQFSSQIKNDPDAVRNLSIFLFSSFRLYTRNKEFSEPMKLLRDFKKRNIISPINAFKFQLYIILSSVGLNKVRGYERFWNVFVRLKRYPMTWGKRTYVGQL